MLILLTIVAALASAPFGFAIGSIMRQRSGWAIRPIYRACASTAFGESSESPMSGLVWFALTSLWHGLLFAVAVGSAALCGKLAGPPIASTLEVHESIPTAVIFFTLLALAGWLYHRFGPRSVKTIAYPYIWP